MQRALNFRGEFPKPQPPNLNSFQVKKKIVLLYNFFLENYWTKLNIDYSCKRRIPSKLNNNSGVVREALPIRSSQWLVLSHDSCADEIQSAFRHHALRRYPDNSSRAVFQMTKPPLPSRSLLAHMRSFLHPPPTSMSAFMPDLFSFF